MTLRQLWDKGGVLKYPTDKEYVHHYLDTYDVILKPYKNKKIDLFECGYGDGGSCKLWEDYFLNAQIHAIDIEKRDHVWSAGGKDFPIHSDRVKFDIINLYDLNLNGSFYDIAIDDGSHELIDQVIFILKLWSKIRTGGMMVIEDVFFERIEEFEKLRIPFTVVDTREEIGRDDNILVIFRK